MKWYQGTGRTLAVAMVGMVWAGAAPADIVTANCTGMLDLDIYTFDTTLDRQDIAGIGLADFTMDEDAIRLEGDFGSYRFDLNAGTLYHNDSDTGLYCTYKTREE